MTERAGPAKATPQARAIAMIRTAMIEKKITQAELADAADCHEKTVQNLLAGKSVRQQTLFDICMVLGLDYEAVRATWSGETPGSVAITGERATAGSVARNSATAPTESGIGGEIAPVYMGAYTRAGVDHYLGSYLTLRPDFTEPGAIVAYRTDITWDASWPSLLFEESGRPDATYAHRGRLYIPAASMFIHLVSLTKGAMRMIVVSQLDRAGVMRGLITTLNKSRATLVPVSTPIVFVKRDDVADVALGTKRPGTTAYDDFESLLTETVEQGYARLVPVAGKPRT